VPVIHPKVYIPNHWDGLFYPFWKGMPYPFKDADLAAYLEAQKIPMLPQKQYFDTYVLTTSGVTMRDNDQVKAKLGFSKEQRFDKAMLDAVTRVASTTTGEDCGESFGQPSAWTTQLAGLKASRAVWLVSTASGR